MNTTRHRAIALSALAALFLLAGCSSGPGVDTGVRSSTPSPFPTPEETAEVTQAASEEPTSTSTEESEPEREITISEVGFIDGGKYGSPMAYAVVGNPTEDAAFVTVDFTAYDADDAVLTTETGFTPLARAGQTMISVADLYLPEGVRVDHVDATITQADTDKDTHPESQMHGIDLAFFADEYAPRLTGKIESAYINSYDQVEVVALCRDGDEVVGVGYTYVDRFVTPDTPVPFELSLTGTGSSESCDVLAAPGWLSEERTPGEA